MTKKHVQVQWQAAWLYDVDNHEVYLPPSLILTDSARVVLLPHLVSKMHADKGKLVLQAVLI